MERRWWWEGGIPLGDDCNMLGGSSGSDITGSRKREREEKYI